MPGGEGNRTLPEHCEADATGQRDTPLPVKEAADRAGAGVIILYLVGPFYTPFCTLATGTILGDMYIYSASAPLETYCNYQGGMLAHNFYLEVGISEYQGVKRET